MTDIFKNAGKLLDLIRYYICRKITLLNYLLCRKMASKARGKAVPKKRVQRATSNIFAMFDQAQIQEFKEAFNMIDQNRDGFIDKDDLKEMYASLGKK